MSGHRYLFAQLVRRELRRKYQGSSLGLLFYHRLMGTESGPAAIEAAP